MRSYRLRIQFAVFLSNLDAFYFCVFSLWLELPRHPCLVTDLRRKVLSVYVAFFFFICGIFKKSFYFPFFKIIFSQKADSPHHLFPQHNFYLRVFIAI